MLLPFILSAITTPGGITAQPTSSNLGTRPGHKRRILVVDDEKNIRLTVQHSLIAADYEVETAANGAEGLERFRDDHYDLILMDLRMPQINGIEMLRTIREHDKHTAAIVITAYLTIDTLLKRFPSAFPITFASHFRRTMSARWSGRRAFTRNVGYP